MIGVRWTLGAILTGALLIWGYGVYSDAQDAKLAVWKAKVLAAELATDSIRLLAARRDTLYRAGETVYIRGRDRILGNTVTPPSPQVSACYAEADKVIGLCQQRHTADSAAIGALTRELNLWKAKPEPRLKRVQAYGEGMYDLAHSVPVIRLGATAKLLGPLNLSVAGEYAAPRQGENTPAFRASVGMRYNFD